MKEYNIITDISITNKSNDIYVLQNYQETSFGDNNAYFTVSDFYSEELLTNTVFELYSNCIVGSTIMIGFVLGKDLLKYYNNGNIGSVPVYSDTYGNHYKMEINPAERHVTIDDISVTITGAVPILFDKHREFLQGNTCNLFKGTDKDGTCRGFKYNLQMEYNEESPMICERGYHACLYPLHCFYFYPPNLSRYFKGEGELFDTIDDSKNIDDSDGKYVFKKLTLKKEIRSVKELVQYCKDVICENEEKIYGITDTDNINIEDIPEKYPIQVTYDDDQIDWDWVLHRDNVYIDSKNDNVSAYGDCSIIKNEERSSFSIVHGHYSIAYSKKERSISESFSSDSIAYTSSNNSVAVSRGLGSVSETDDKSSVSISFHTGSLAKSNGKESVAVAYWGTACTNEKNSVAVSYNDQSESYGDYSTCVGHSSDIKVNGKYSVGVGYSRSTISVKAGSAGVATVLVPNPDAAIYAANKNQEINWNSGERNLYVNRIIMKGEIGSVLIWNFLHNGKVINSYSFIVDGETVKENEFYECKINGVLNNIDDHEEE